MKVKVLTPIFAEAASKLVNATSKHPNTILIKKDHWVVDAKSLLGVLAIALQPGQIIEFSMETEDKELLAELKQLELFEETN
ncbi:HPr family phosphocarrier protein [Anaerobacillus isosaccharinicus]|uniref:HPr family phosphocarrier protein n=1 Tax=Anaerobacillus isosaccharinicus TaxID=1532552 RepID=A0A1S2LRE1_9BACI|nr:HPr family phosphocarrier protein [Anaerobacillus isosaccharinicus]MBA5585411.1 HPr family phosphocarrier protein [Anaerobacillus isosaccharinicus]QOY36270.1 HPr family phosphocarrier protein [Anaerobacillus isosaccharinicus]